jgi:hypothetical protein
MRNLKCSAASGPDGLSPFILKHCAAELTDVITVVVNKSLSTGVIPMSWKSSKIVPIPKKNDNPFAETKYRPIACIASLMKVTEHYLLRKIQPVLNSVSDAYQFAYKKKRSTLDAVAYLQHLICSNLDAGCSKFECIFLDFSSAFNTISRQSILDKMNDLGLPSWIVTWIFNYFLNCTQYVFANGTRSESIGNDHGVLQGAVLSPALFSLLTDSLVSHNSSHLLKYADDTTLANKLKSASDFELLNESLRAIEDWSAENSLVLNNAKCVECLFHFRSCQSRQSIQRNPSIDGMPLSEVDSVKYLGIHFSSDCTWSLQVQNIFSKCLRLSFVIKRLVKLHVPNVVLKTFVHACVLPVILYCSPVIFCGLLVKDANILRRAIKLISRASGSNYEELVNVITRRHFDACVKFSQQILSDPLHPLNEYLSPSRSFSSTRRTFNLIYSRTSAYRRSVVPFLARVLADSSKESDIFKRMLL